MAAVSSWTVLHELWAVAHRAERVVARDLAGAGVDGTELAVLGLLGRMCSATTTELAGEFGVPFMTMSSALQRLESRGELVRRANPDDGRSHFFALSDEGQARARAAGRVVDASIEGLATEIDLDELREDGARRNRPELRRPGTAGRRHRARRLSRQLALDHWPRARRPSRRSEQRPCAGDRDDRPGRSRHRRRPGSRRRARGHHAGAARGDPVVESVQTIDPAIDAVTSTLTTGETVYAGGLAAAAGNVWIANVVDGRITAAI